MADDRERTARSARDEHDAAAPDEAADDWAGRHPSPNRRATTGPAAVTRTKELARSRRLASELPVSDKCAARAARVGCDDDSRCFKIRV